MRSVVVYCGSKTGDNPVYARAAEALGRLLAERKITLVYGGTKVGLMGILAESAMAAGGKVVGVITRDLNAAEVGNAQVAELSIVPTMHERKHIMCQQAEGAIILPGAFGTHDELFEFVTWNQLGVHTKPCGILNVNGFYEFLFRHLDKMVSEGFLRQEHRDLLLVSKDANKLLEMMDAWKESHPTTAKYKLV